MLRRTALPLMLAATVALTLAACGGGSTAATVSPDRAIAQAKAAFDTTAGVHVHLEGKDLPSGNVLVGADGTLTRAPAFDGKIAVKVLGATTQVPVISVDDEVYAKLPLTVSWQRIDPAQYGVPDPASLIAPATGISHLLTATTGLKTQGTVRGGKDNKEILTTYTGSLAASAVATIISSASGTFGVAYTIGNSHQLQEAVISGRFYGPDKPSSTYTVTLDDYGVTKTITQP